MEASSRTEALSAEQLRLADQGFAQLLRAKRMHPQFIAEHAEELMGQACREYASWCERGNVATNPPGWLILCAWRRTKDLLKAQERRPRQLAIEEVLHVVDEQTPTPEEALLDRDRSNRIVQALARLPEKERRLVYLTYFNGLDVKAAGEIVGWKKSAAHRHHDAALERLQAMLGRDFAILDVALAAWVLRDTGSTGAPAGGVAALLADAQDAATYAWHRVAEIARRLSPLGDPANASLASAGARVSGACAAAAAVACFASGVVGPGIGALKADPQAVVRPVKRAAQTVSPPPKPIEPVRRTVDPTPEARSQEAPKQAARRAPRPASREEGGPGLAAAEQQTPTISPTPESSAPQQTQTEFGIEHESASEPSAPSGGGSTSPVAPHTEVPPARPSGSAVSQEFGM
jgi:RNA polymerase sigma factor (sigma-70 family)